MKHFSREALWELCAGEASADDVDRIESHLELCASCRALRSEVEMARSVLNSLPAPPPLPAPLAARVERAVIVQLEAPADTWLASLTKVLSLRLGFAVAVACTIALLWRWTLVPPTLPLTPPPPTPALAANQTEHIEAPAPAAPVRPQKLSATISVARKARVGKTPASVHQVLEEGSVVTTEATGALSLQLPDGSRAKLRPTSQVTLTTIEAKVLRLDVEKGSLALKVPHRDDRLLTVMAGEVEVRDLGTAFVVSREIGQILVAVEEGSVEVRVPGKTQTVTAGMVLSWKNGQLRQTALPPPERQTSEESTPTSRAKLTDEDDELETPPTDPFPLQPPGAINEWPQPAPEQTAENKSSGDSIGKRLPDFGRKLPPPLGTGDKGRALRAQEVERLADEAACQEALQVADLWLAEPGKRPPNEAQLRRGVLSAKLRCLNKLGRAAEADLVRQEMLHSYR